MWKYIFQMVDSVDKNMPLSPKILQNPSHKFVKTLLYIYSMESFVFSVINKASRNKDVDKIESFGPFASALSYIIYSGNIKNAKLSNEFRLYRGLKMNED